jgi:N-acetylneuraminate synthase/sialic acid synthase
MFKENTSEEKSFFIAEVGQNHQGKLDAAIEYIRVFAQAGANAVKFQARNNKYLFSKEAYEAAYHSENAFAETYGAHREHLELKPEWYKIIKEECLEAGVKFMCTPFDEPSLEMLLNSEIDVDIIKIASFDCGNLPFIQLIANAKKPVVMSIGGGQAEQIKSSVELLLNAGVELAVLHCVSEYPCEYNRLGLNSIEELIKLFPGCIIGSSDHFNGTLSGPIAFMKGARIFEKHVTLNRSWKGTDHGFALEPDGFRKFVRDIQRVPGMMNPKPVGELGQEQVFQKLGKSLVAKINIEKGSVITWNMLSGKIHTKQYIQVRESNKIIGRVAKKFIEQGQAITYEDIN